MASEGDWERAFDAKRGDIWESKHGLRCVVQSANARDVVIKWDADGATETRGLRRFHRTFKFIRPAPPPAEQRQ